VTCCTSEKIVGLKVSETGQSCMHLDDAESDEPLYAEPAAGCHHPATRRHAENWSSGRHNEDFITMNHRSDGSTLQEIMIVDDVESDRHCDVFDSDSADAEPAPDVCDLVGEREETLNSADAVGTGSEKGSCIIDTAKVEMETTLASAERAISTQRDNCSGGELVVFTSGFDVDSASDVDGLSVAAAAIHSLASDCQTGSENSYYHEADDVGVADSMSDMISSYVNDSVAEASGHLTASDQRVQDGNEMDITEELDVDQSVDELGSSQAQTASSDLPCVSKSELCLADESRSGLLSHGGCEEEAKVCCACVLYVSNVHGTISCIVCYTVWC